MTDHEFESYCLIKGEEAQEKTSKHNTVIKKNFSMKNCSIDHFPRVNYHHALK